jgi:DNA-binding NtrC family response regulator
MVDKNKENLIRVLLVIYEPILLETTAECLNLQGDLITETALSIDEAMTKMQNTKFDVVVCDLDTPLTNAFDFLKKIRDKGDKTPFIMFAVSGERELAVKARILGANGFVEKYGDPNIVFPTLKKCILSVIEN